LNKRTRRQDWKPALRVWWAYTWRFAVFFLPAVWLLPLLLFYFQPPVIVRKLASFGLFAYMIALQIELFRRILDMDFGSFRVLVERPE
jgi:hypothetical protein